MRRIRILVTLGVLTVAPVASASADEVLFWNDVLLRAMRTAATAGPVQGRVAAIVHVAMFEALNGIERRFEPIHDIGVPAPRGASQRAAVAQAAFTALAGLFPSQIAAFEADLETSLSGIAADAAIEHSESIERGRDWGERVAQEILAWRSTDGFDPSPSTYIGSTDVGKWRPTPRPPATPGGPELPGLPGLVPSMATTEPFVIPFPWSFRPAGPPALTSAEYARDVEEVKSVGESISSTRSPDQTESARFWGGTALGFWNRAAITASQQRNLTLSENARLFALLNAAVADAVIACWDSKQHFELWRPITAIRLAHTEGNPGTTVQPTWTPLLVTPPYPEYYSGHQSVSGVSQAVLTAYFGDDTPVEGFSEGFPGVVRSYANFAAAADDAFMARIWAGIHFRFAMRDTRVNAERIAAYVLENAAQPVNGKKKGQSK
jgi:hypothetical protein